MEKLEQLKREANEAIQNFINGKNGELVALHKEQERAIKAYRDYDAWLHKGSGVFGNEI
jgi:hypothetical protein